MISPLWPLLLCLVAASDSLEARLDRGLGLMLEADREGSIPELDYSARMIASAFFAPAAMTDSKGVEVLNAKMLRWLNINSNLSIQALIELRDAFDRDLSEIQKDESYVNRGWVVALGASSLAFLPLHLLFVKPTRRLGAKFRTKSQDCRRHISRLSTKALSHLLVRRPRWSLFLLTVPAASYGANLWYFSEYENWRSSERAVRNDILPRIKELLSSKARP